MSLNLVILDRDGVINFDSDNYIKSLSEWQPIPNSIEAISELSKAGFTVAVATNQSGLARKYFTLDTLTAMHKKMSALVENLGGKISNVFFCPHHPEEKCICRKPNTGLLQQIEKYYDQSVKDCWFIGDSQKDIDVALAKDCKPILVLTGKGQITEKGLNSSQRLKVLIFKDLASATRFILSENINA